MGIYVHFPYCLKKCPYCDFLSVATDPAEIDHIGYAETVLWELEQRGRVLGKRRLDSVFFGGGTPSLWNPSELGRVLGAVLAKWPEPNAPEVTVECNPTSLDADRARALRDQGVSRLSIGVQGLDADRLEFLGRLHDPALALAAVRGALVAGVRVSADVIFGVAGQTAAQAADEVGQLADLGVTHLSAYALTIEPGTLFGALAQKHRLPLLDESDVARSFEAVERTLDARGFEHYEISNYARDGHYAVHNLGYWRGNDYLGLGCGAWGTVTTGRGKLRYRNTPNPERYLHWRGDSADGWCSSELTSVVEPIDGQTAVSEAIMLGLRLAEGVNLGQLEARIGVSPWSAARQASIARLVRSGQLERRDDRIWIPREKWLLSDGIIAQLM
jgi:oxygen-independent coproporphyrinogen-3 oxidase